MACLLEIFRSPNDLTFHKFANTGRKGFRHLPIAWLTSPGFAVISSWRLAARLNRAGPLGRLAAFVVWRAFVAGNGCYISLHAKIGPRLRLPHAVGVVIGDGCVIGADVTIYHNVTLGRRRADLSEYPTLGDGATVYCGTVILGKVTVGAGAVIGANQVVRRDVAAGAVFVGG